MIARRSSRRSTVRCSRTSRTCICSSAWHSWRERGGDARFRVSPMTGRFIPPVTLHGAHGRLEPLARGHLDGIRSAAADGELWKLWYTSVPPPERTQAWIDAALDMRERLGAKQDGVLRNHQLMPDGSRRDTVVFSILDSEWPAVRAHLNFLVGRPRSP